MSGPRSPILGIAGVWGGLGNIYRKNTFNSLAHIGVEFESWGYNGADYNGTVFEGNRFTNLIFGFIDAFHLMWTYTAASKLRPFTVHANTTRSSTRISSIEDPHWHREAWDSKHCNRRIHG